MYKVSVNLLRSPALLTILGRGLQFASQLAMVVVIPKVLVPELYAQFNLVVPLSYLLSTFVFGWLTRSLYRHVHEMLDPAGVRVRQTVFLYLGLATISMAAIFIIAISHTDSLYALLPVLLAVSGLKTCVLGTLNAAEKHRDFFFTHLGFAVSLGVFITMCVIEMEGGLRLYLSIYAIIDMFLAIIAWWRIGVVDLRKTPHFDMEIASRYFRYGLPLVAHNVALWVISVSDRYLLTLWESSVRVADYILSYQLASGVVTIPLNVAMLLIFPKMIRIDKEAGEAAALDYAYQLLGYYIRYLPVMLIAICAIVIPFKYYFYPEYEFHPVVIAIIIMAQMIFVLSAFYNKEFELNRRTLIVTKSIGIGAVLNVAMNLALIPLLGLLGAALATFAAYSVTVFIVYRAREYRPGTAR